MRPVPIKITVGGQHLLSVWSEASATGYWLWCHGCGPTTGCWGTSLSYFYLELSTGRHPLWNTRHQLHLCDMSTCHTIDQFYTCRLETSGFLHDPQALSHLSAHYTKVHRCGWSGLQKQVGIWTKQCLPCQSSKIQTHIDQSPTWEFQHPPMPVRSFSYRSSI